jgi:glutathionylspermidine synthase
MSAPVPAVAQEPARLRCDAPALPEDVFALVRRRAMFECCKWDPQLEDVSVLAPFPLIELSGLAEALAAETAAAERELVARPELHGELGLPRGLRKALAEASERGSSAGAAKVMRFDFHLTSDGWRISEVNADVPGGYNEASGYTGLMAAHYPGHVPAGDPAQALAEAIHAAVGREVTVAFVHATAYADDRQVMEYLGRRWANGGVRARFTAPDGVAWRNGAAHLVTARGSELLGFIFRFFPAEWLAKLPAGCGWEHFFRGGRTPACNPGTALLVQSKRFPLVWDRLRTPLATWRALLPETVEPAGLTHSWADDWVLKPALGRVGEGVGVPGATEPAEMAASLRAARKRPAEWVAQRRFEPVPFVRDGQSCYPCIGVYTVAGRAAGAYGRLSLRKLTDKRSQDIAVLVSSDGETS